MPVTRKKERIAAYDIDIALQPKQFALLDAVKRGTRHPFYGGARGGGKSYASRFIMLAMLLQNPKTTGLLVRRTFKQLDGNHIRPLFRQFPEMRSWYNKSEGVLYLPNNSEWQFGHCEHEDDVYQYQGQEYDYVGVEEVTQFTEFQWEILTTCNRTSNKGIKPVMWATGNPGGIGHLWVKRLWIDREFNKDLEDEADYRYIPARVWDNPALMEADPKYVKVLEAIKDPEIRRAFLAGDWDIYPGQFFTQFQRSQIEIKSFDVPENWPIYGSYDHGTTSPASFSLSTVDYDGRVYRICEYYQADRSVSDHAKAIKERINSCPFTDGRSPALIYADPSVFTKVRVSEENTKSPADIFAEHGVYLTRANNDRVPGWAICKDAIIHDKFFAFAGWNDNFFRTVPGLPRSNRNVEDVDTDAEDHAADEWRYGMVHMYKPGKPKFGQKFGSGQTILDSLDDYESYGRYHKKVLAN